MDRGTPGPLRIVGVSIAAIAAGTFISVSLGVLAPELRDAFGFSRFEIGLLTSLYALGGALSSGFAGGLTDRVPPSRVLGLSLLLMAAAAVGGSLSPTGAVLMLFAFAAGAGYGGINPPTNVIVAGRLGERLGFFLSLKQTGVPLGGFAAGLVLPAVVAAAGWRWAFAVGAFGTAAAACTVGLVRGAAVLGASSAPASSASGSSATGSSATGSPIVAPASPPRRDAISIVTYGFLLAGCQWVMMAYLVLSLHDGRGWSLTEAGLTLSAVTAVSVCGRLAWGWLSDRLGSREPTLLALAAASVLGLAVLAAEPPRLVVFLAAALLGGSLAAWNGVYHALVVERSGAGALGRDSGRMLAFLFAGSVCVPPLLGLLSQRTGSWTVLWAAAAALVAVAGLVLRFGLTPRSRLRPQSPAPAAVGAPVE